MVSTTETQAVFVVHGRDRTARDAMFGFLRSIGLRPLEWSQAVELTGSAAPYVGDILQAAFSAARAVVVLLTPDDHVMLREELRASDDPPYESVLTGQARPNVLFEAGMAFGQDDKRTVLVELGPLRPFSDVAGRHVLRFDGSVARRQELGLRLLAAGCSVDMTGTDWHTAGEFPYGKSIAVPGEAGKLREAGEICTADATEQAFPSLTVALIPAGPGRYDLTLANDSTEDIPSLTLDLPAEAPFHLFDRDKIERRVPAGQMITLTLVALHDDARLVDLPATLRASYGDDTTHATVIRLTSPD